MMNGVKSVQYKWCYTVRFKQIPVKLVMVCVLYCCRWWSFCCPEEPTSMRLIRRTGELYTGLRIWVSHSRNRYISSASLLSAVRRALVSNRLSHFRLMSIQSSALMVCVSLWLFCGKGSCVSLLSQSFFSSFVPLFTICHCIAVSPPSLFISPPPLILRSYGGCALVSVSWCWGGV